MTARLGAHFMPYLFRRSAQIWNWNNRTGNRLVLH